MSLKFSSEKKACQNKLLRLLSGHYGNTVIGVFEAMTCFYTLMKLIIYLSPIILLFFSGPCLSFNTQRNMVLWWAQSTSPPVDIWLTDLTKTGGGPPPSLATTLKPTYQNRSYKCLGLNKYGFGLHL